MLNFTAPLRITTLVITLSLNTLPTVLWADDNTAQTNSQPSTIADVKINAPQASPNTTEPAIKTGITNMPEVLSDAQTLAGGVHVKISPAQDDDQETASARSLKELMAVFGLFIAPFLVIFSMAKIKSAERIKRLQNRDALIEKFLAAGKEIPQEIFSEHNDSPQKNSHFHKGVMNIALGAGLSLLLSVIIELKFGAIGLVFVILGISRLFLWKYAPKDDSSFPSKD